MTDWLQLESGGRVLRADASSGYDLSIPLAFDGEQPSFFAAPDASAHPYRIGHFTGSVATGSSCNCTTHTLTPHCNGTHTECVGHVTLERLSIRDVRIPSLLIAHLVSVRPRPLADLDEAIPSDSDSSDPVVGRAQLEAVLPAMHCSALIVRTLPNTRDKQSRNYDATCPPYLSAGAAQFLVERRVDHLVLDLPSIDRAHDGGHLAAHRIFWGLPPGATDAKLARRSHATITELAFIDDSIADGEYLLNLQVAPFAADAAPSRPMLYRVTAR
ncbi:MAG TPA: cyclase family protein [Steroidobacteraceae bacterium]|nr:cyclase family protein [Steroidobacteraceae bacterium]